MTTSPPPNSPVRARREPPPFRRVTVRRVEPLTPYLVRITLAGPELGGLRVDEPAASVRMLIPRAPDAELVVPAWKGNEFLLPDGRRPHLRTFTPRRVDEDALELDLDVVLHGTGPASEWAAVAEPGRVAAVSGPGRGYTIESDASAFVLAGDETAIPAMSQLLEVLPRATPVRMLAEVTHPDARPALPDHPNATVEWHDRAPDDPPGSALVAAVQSMTIAAGTRVWAAGEAAAMQRIRRHLFDVVDMPRAQTTVRGYWKHGRAGGDES